MSEYKPIRFRRGRLVHATDVESMRVTQCGKPCDGVVLLADEVPTCKACLRAILDDPELN